MKMLNVTLRHAAAVLFMALAMSLILPGGAGAQSDAGETAASDVPDLPADLTKPEIRDILSRLSDDEVRELLIRQLDKVAAADAEVVDDETFADSLEDSVSRIHMRASSLVAALPLTPTIFSFLIDSMTAGKDPSHVWTILLFTVIIFAAGAAVEWLFRRSFTRLGQMTHHGPMETTSQRLCVFALRVVIDIVAIAVFGIAASVVFFIFYQNHEPTREAITAVFWAVILVRVIVAVANDLFCPRQPAIRTLPLSDQAARWAYGRLVWIAGVIVAVWYFGTLLRHYSLAENEGLALAVTAILTFAVLFWIVVLIWLDRRTVGAMILAGNTDNGTPPSQAKTFLAANWHVLATCYILGLWLFSQVERLLTGEPQGWPIVISLVLLPAIPMIDWLLRAVIRRMCDGARRDETADVEIAEPAEQPSAPQSVSQDGITLETIDPQPSPPRTSESTGHAIEPVLIRNMRIVLALVVVMFLAGVWGIDIESFLVAGVGQRIAEALFDIVVTLILASAIWGIVKAMIGHYAPQDGIDIQQMVEGEIGGTGQSRMATLLPLFRKFILITLAVIVTLVILSSLGISIGPLIAGAGVVGLAIGFGAQTLVRDILSGAFFLADDAFRVGEYIDVGVAKGMVEKISIRSFRLRHHRGAINTIPFGEVQMVMNYSRDWVMMKLEMRVPSDTDLEKLRKVVKKVGQEIMDNPELGPHLLQPVKSQGVNRMDDDGAFVIRIKFMAKPGEQFVLRREVFTRVQIAFAENGIKFAPKRVMIDAQVGASDAELAAAAVAAEQSRA